MTPNNGMIESLLKLRDCIIETRENESLSDELLQGLEDLEKIVVKETREELRGRNPWREIKPGNSLEEAADVSGDLAELEELADKLDRKIYDVCRRLDRLEADA